MRPTTLAAQRDINARPPRFARLAGGLDLTLRQPGRGARAFQARKRRYVCLSFTSFDAAGLTEMSVAVIVAVPTVLDAVTVAV